MRTVAAACLILGCQPKEVREATPTPPHEAAAKGKAQAGVTLSIPAAVPAIAAGAAVVAVEGSVLEAALAIDPFGFGIDVDALKLALDEFLVASFGVALTEAESLAVFVFNANGPKFGLIVAGTTGEPRGREVAKHEGVTLRQLPDVHDLVAARAGGDLILGHRGAVEAAISARNGSTRRLVDAPLGGFLRSETRGASLAAAADVSRLPDAFRDQLPRKFELKLIGGSVGTRGFRAFAEATPAGAERMREELADGLTRMRKEISQERDSAVRRDNVAAGAALIFAAYYIDALAKALKPKVQAGRVSVNIPLQVGNPAAVSAAVGLAAAVAIPSVVKYTRRSKTSEARVQLAKMFDTTAAFFTAWDKNPHLCPNDGRLAGDSGTTPPLSVDCSAGPGEHCVPSTTPDRPAFYDHRLWADNPVWQQLNFSMDQGHAFHYRFKWANNRAGFGSCQFTAQAFGDLDGDGIFSTYERSGAADEHGVNAAAGLYIDRELE